MRSLSLFFLPPLPRHCLSRCHVAVNVGANDEPKCDWEVGVGGVGGLEGACPAVGSSNEMKLNQIAEPSKAEREERKSRQELP